MIVFADSVPWIADGWGHELLGLAAFGFILLMAGLTDAAVFGIIENELYLVTHSQSINDVYSESEFRFRDLTFKLTPFPLVGPSRSRVLIGFTVVAMVSLRSAWIRSSVVPYAEKRTNAVTAVVSDDVLSENLAGFRRTNFRHESRGPNYLRAQHSFHWNYTNDNLTATVSLDTPWNTWHNLDVCYSNVGWMTEPTFAIIPESGSADDHHGTDLANELGFSHSEIVMRRTRQWGMVVFSAIDRHGNPIREPKLNEQLSLYGLFEIFSSRLFDGL